MQFISIFPAFLLKWIHLLISLSLPTSSFSLCSLRFLPRSSLPPSFPSPYYQRHHHHYLNSPSSSLTRLGNKLQMRIMKCSFLLRSPSRVCGPRSRTCQNLLALAYALTYDLLLSFPELYKFEFNSASCSRWASQGVSNSQVARNTEALCLRRTNSPTYTGAAVGMSFVSVYKVGLSC